MALAGKIAFVTGAGSGIGRATCKILASQGASIVAADKIMKSANETIELLSKSPNQIHTGLEIDVAQSESVQNACKKTMEIYKNPPSIVVNSAGITRDNFLMKLAEHDFDSVVDVNLKGTFLVTQIFAKAITENQIKNASIVNIASIIGKIGNMGQCNYAASKAGVEAFTKSVSKELGQFGVRVNAILPGMIETPMIEHVPDKVKAKFQGFISLGRFGKPEEIGEVISFLASEKSSYITGTSIEVTGGM